MARKKPEPKTETPELLAGKYLDMYILCHDNKDSLIRIRSMHFNAWRNSGYSDKESEKLYNKYDKEVDKELERVRYYRQQVFSLMCTGIDARRKDPTGYYKPEEGK